MAAQTTKLRKAFNKHRQEITFHDKTRFKQYLSTNPAIQKVLEGKLQPKKCNHTYKTQAIDNPTQAKHKEVKYTYTIP